MVVNKEIKATILIVTYNHADYIAAAIESALCQKTSFAVEIIVSEDASTDGTREIVRKIAANRAGQIRLMLSDQNLHSNEVVARGLRTAKGKYISLLDGDDYWTSQDKIQRQSEFLDTHSECAAVFLNAKVAKGDEVTSHSWTPHSQMQFADISEIWCGNPYATCTSMMRASLVRGVPDWYADFFPITDWPLYILCAEHGKLAFLDEDAAVYRLHAGGQFSSLPPRKRLELNGDFLQTDERGAWFSSRPDGSRGSLKIFFRLGGRVCAAGPARLGGRVPHALHPNGRPKGGFSDR